MGLELWMFDQNSFSVRIDGRRSAVENIIVGIRRSETSPEAVHVVESLWQLIPLRTIPCEEQGGWTAFLTYHPATGLRWQRSSDDVKREEGMRWPGIFPVGEMYDKFRELFGVELGRLWFDLDMEHAHLESWRPRTRRSPDVTVN